MNAAGALPRPDIAAAVRRSATVAEVLAAPSALGLAGALYLRHFGAGPACLIADENTWAAAGPAVAASLSAAGISARRHVLPGAPRPKPSVELAGELAAVIAADGATPVAIGSGVLNDVVKYAAFGLSRPYLCVATAASMDGYTSAGAPLSERGFKKTIACRPARAVLADLDVLAAAPPEMTGWGFGDLAGKVPAGADWILADALGIEPVDPDVWPMVQDGLKPLLARAAAIAAGDRAALEDLFAALTMVGLAMERHGSSRPASGADHQIAHLWEMEGLSQEGERVSHGACVAVGTMAVLRLYDWLLRQDLTRIDPAALASSAPDLAAKEAEIRSGLGAGEIGDRALAETRAKHIGGAALASRLKRLAAAWPGLAPRLRAQVLAPSEMASLLRAAGAPVEAGDIGVTPAHLRRTIRNARFLRDRYTLLDLLDETGLLDAAIDAAAPAGAP